VRIAEAAGCRRLPFGRLATTVWRDARRHQLQVFAGDLAYNAFLALIPFLLFVVLLLDSLHASDQLTAAIGVFTATLPASSAALLEDQIQGEVASRVPDWWPLGVLLALGSLWACSAAFRALTTALNVMYDANDDRPLVVGLGMSVILALASVATWLIMFVCVRTLSAAVVGLTGQPSGPSWTVTSAAVMLLGAFGLSVALFTVVPCDRRPFRAIVPGAVCTATVWLVFSLAFAFVLNEFGQFLVDPLYGWFSGLFALLLYLYWSAYILLIGAELNHAIEVAKRAGTCPR
jgi:membrane protein